MPNPAELSAKQSSPRTNPLGNIKGILTSSYGIAAIASLSFHAALFAAIPRFSSASFAAFSEEETTGEARTVPLVTLSPTEQGRLPDFNTPQLPSIPDISSPRSSISNLPNASTFNRPTSSIFNRSNSRLNTPAFTPPSSLSRNRPFRNPYIPRPNLSISNTPSRSEQSSDRRTAVITDIPQPPSSPAGDLNTDDDTLARQLEIERRQAADAAAQAEAAPGLPELPDDSDAITAPEGEFGENTEIAANPEATTEPSHLDRLTAKYKHDATNTTPDEVEANYAAWFAPPEEESDVIIDTAEIVEVPLEADFNLLCDQTPPSNGEIGVLVAPDGTPSNATVLQSTGYAHLNQLAVDALMDSEFSETDNAVRYPFEIIVNYDAESCTSSDELLETVRNVPDSGQE